MQSAHLGEGHGVRRGPRVVQLARESGGGPQIDEYPVVRPRRRVRNGRPGSRSHPAAPEATTGKDSTASLRERPLSFSLPLTGPLSRARGRLLLGQPRPRGRALAAPPPAREIRAALARSSIPFCFLFVRARSGSVLGLCCGCCERPPFLATPLGSLFARTFPVPFGTRAPPTAAACPGTRGPVARRCPIPIYLCLCLRTECRSALIVL